MFKHPYKTTLRKTCSIITTIINKMYLYSPISYFRMSTIFQRCLSVHPISDCCKSKEFPAITVSSNPLAWNPPTENPLDGRCALSNTVSYYSEEVIYVQVTMWLVSTAQKLLLYYTNTNNLFIKHSLGKQVSSVELHITWNIELRTENWKLIKWKCLSVFPWTHLPFGTVLCN